MNISQLRHPIYFEHEVVLMIRQWIILDIRTSSSAKKSMIKNLNGMVLVKKYSPSLNMQYPIGTHIPNAMTENSARHNGRKASLYLCSSVGVRFYVTIKSAFERWFFPVIFLRYEWAPCESNTTYVAGEFSSPSPIKDKFDANKIKLIKQYTIVTRPNHWSRKTTVKSLHLIDRRFPV